MIEETKLTFFCRDCGLAVEKCECAEKTPTPGEPYFKILEQGRRGKFKAGPKYVFHSPEDMADCRPSEILPGTWDCPYRIKLAPGEIRVTQQALDKYGSDFLRRLGGVDHDAKIIVDDTPSS